VTLDGGRSWGELSQISSAVSSVDFISASQGWINGGGGLSVTADGGRTWQLVNGTDLPENVHVRFVDAVHGWAAASYNDTPDRAIGDSKVFATSDGGRSWALLNTPCGDSWSLALSPLDATTAWLACGGQPATAMQKKALHRTLDLGQNWELVSSDAMFWSGHLNGLSSLGEFSWMSTSRGGLYSSGDGGVSWQHIPTGVGCGDEFISAPQLLSADIGFVLAPKCGDLMHLLATRDRGITWSSLYPPPFLEACSTPELRRESDLCGDFPSQ